MYAPQAGHGGGQGGGGGAGKAGGGGGGGGQAGALVGEVAFEGQPAGAGGVAGGVAGAAGGGGPVVRVGPAELLEGLRELAAEFADALVVAAADSRELGTDLDRFGFNPTPVRARGRDKRVHACRRSGRCCCHARPCVPLVPGLALLLVALP